MEGLEAKIQQFKAAWQELSIAFLDSDFLKGLVDFGTSAVTVLTKIIDAVGTLNVILAGVGLYAFIKNFD